MLCNYRVCALFHDTCVVHESSWQLLQSVGLLLQSDSLSPPSKRQAPLKSGLCAAYWVGVSTDSWAVACRFLGACLQTFGLLMHLTSGCAVVQVLLASTLRRVQCSGAFYATQPGAVRACADFCGGAQDHVVCTGSNAWLPSCSVCGPPPALFFWLCYPSHCWVCVVGPGVCCGAAVSVPCSPSCSVGVYLCYPSHCWVVGRV